MRPYLLEIVEGALRVVVVDVGLDVRNIESSPLLFETLQSRVLAVQLQALVAQQVQLGCTRPRNADCDIILGSDVAVVLEVDFVIFLGLSFEGAETGVLVVDDVGLEMGLKGGLDHKVAFAVSAEGVLDRGGDEVLMGVVLAARVAAHLNLLDGLSSSYVVEPFLTMLLEVRVRLAHLVPQQLLHHLSVHLPLLLVLRQQVRHCCAAQDLAEGRLLEHLIVPLLVLVVSLFEGTPVFEEGVAVVPRRLHLESVDSLNKVPILIKFVLALEDLFPFGGL